MLVRLAQPPFGLDDPRDLVIKPAERHGLADRLVAREEGERHALVDHDDVLRALHVRLADEPPVEQRFMRHVEIARADRVNRRLRALRLRGEIDPLRPRADRPGRDRICDGGHLLLRFFVERVQLAALLRRRRRGQDVFQPPADGQRQRAAADRQHEPQQHREHAPALFFILHRP